MSTIINTFRAKEDFVLVHKKQHLYGEVVYATEEFPYELSDFVEVPKEKLEKIIQKWQSNGYTNIEEV